jgi:hypothetical protein
MIAIVKEKEKEKEKGRKKEMYIEKHQEQFKIHSLINRKSIFLAAPM